MNRAYCVRAEGGKYTEAFKNGKYAAVGWMGKDLSGVQAGDANALGTLYDSAYPGEGRLKRGLNLGQLSRFAWEMQIGDVIVTPMRRSEYLLVGVVDSPYYHEITPECPYGHRRRITWSEEPLLRSVFSVPVQNTLRSSITVFEVRPPDELLKVLGKAPPTPRSVEQVERRMSSLVLERLLSLDADEFEILVTELLTALGFEAKKTGRTGDGGVDVEGTLTMYNFASVELNVQVKRYKLASKVTHKTVKDFRASVPEKVQAAFVTTGGYTQKAREEAEREGYKRIGLIDGEQLVDILAEEYDRLPQEIRKKLGLRRALMVD